MIRPPCDDTLLRPDSVGVCVLSAEYGESVIVTLPNGQWILVDAFDATYEGFDSAEPVVDFVSAVGLPVDKCAFVIFTHVHHDHFSGLPQVLRRFEHIPLYAHAMYDPIEDSEGCFDALLARERKYFAGLGRKIVDLRRICQRRERSVTWGESVCDGTDSSGRRFSVKVIAPDLTFGREMMVSFARTFHSEADGPHSMSNSLINNTSVVLLIKYGEARIILSGDLEYGGWKRLTANRRNVAADRETVPDFLDQVLFMKVPHHGSRYSFQQRQARRRHQSDLEVILGDGCKFAIMTHNRRGRVRLPDRCGFMRTLRQGVTIAVPNTAWLQEQFPSAVKYSARFSCARKKITFGVAAPLPSVLHLQNTISNCRFVRYASLPELHWISSCISASGDVSNWCGGSQAGFFAKAH